MSALIVLLGALGSAPVVIADQYPLEACRNWGGSVEQPLLWNEWLTHVKIATLQLNGGYLRTRNHEEQPYKEQQTIDYDNARSTHYYVKRYEQHYSPKEGRNSKAPSIDLLAATYYMLIQNPKSGNAVEWFELLIQHLAEYNPQILCHVYNKNIHILENHHDWIRRRRREINKSNKKYLVIITEELDLVYSDNANLISVNQALISSNGKLQSDKDKLQKDKDKLQEDKDKLQEDNETINQKYNDLEAQSQTNSVIYDARLIIANARTDALHESSNAHSDRQNEQHQEDLNAKDDEHKKDLEFRDKNTIKLCSKYDFQDVECAHYKGFCERILKEEKSTENEQFQDACRHKPPIETIESNDESEPTFNPLTPNSLKS